MSIDVYDKTILMQEAQKKLVEAEADICEGKVTEAYPALNELRKKHSI